MNNNELPHAFAFNEGNKSPTYDLCLKSFGFRTTAQKNSGLKQPKPNKRSKLKPIQQVSDQFLQFFS